MIIAVCVDDRMGMLFNHRRQSRDKFVIDDLMNIAEKVKINGFSEELFEDYKISLKMPKGKIYVLWKISTLNRMRIKLTK